MTTDRNSEGRRFVIGGCALLALALIAGYNTGLKSGYEQGSYEQWHEADTWAEQTHAACMEQARTK